MCPLSLAETRNETVDGVLDGKDLMLAPLFLRHSTLSLPSSRAQPPQGADLKGAQRPAGRARPRVREGRNLEVLGHEGQTPKNLLPEVSGSSGILTNPPDQFSAKWAEPRGSGSTCECGSPAVGCRVESRTIPWASRGCRPGPLCSQPPHLKQSPFRVA